MNNRRLCRQVLIVSHVPGSAHYLPDSSQCHGVDTSSMAPALFWIVYGSDRISGLAYGSLQTARITSRDLGSDAGRLGDTEIT